MKFVLSEKPRYWWPVVVRRPDTENAGKIVEETFKVLFEPQSRDEAIASQNQRSQLQTAQEIAAHEHQQLLDVVKSWDEVEDGNKNPIPFTQEVYLQALQQSWVRTGIFQAYADSLNGVEARLGN